MITFVEGRIEDKQPASVVVNVGGIGYQLKIPLSSYDRLPATGGSCRVLTYEHVREDTHDLYGFVSDDERRMFMLLIGVSGVGPKLALSVLSGLSVRDLKAAVVSGDVKRLSSVSGVGRKTAERLVVELRDRITPGEALEAVAGAGGGAADSRSLADAVMALVALGYAQDAANKMVRQAIAAGADVGDVEAVIRKALAR